MKYILIFLLSILELYAFNMDIYNSDISNGRTTIIEFKKEIDTKYDKVKVGKKSYKIYQHPSDKDKMYVLIPVSYYAKPSNMKLEIIYDKNSEKTSKLAFVHIEDGEYEKEEIHVQKSKVNPTDKKVKKRIAKEYAEAMGIYGVSTKQNHVSSKFIEPMNSKITSDFGKARVYNGSLNGYHSGTDYRAKIGTPIKASNDGVVVLAKDRFYSGGTVIIDHGHGIYTCYYHMSKIEVKYGQVIKKAEVIGLSGDTGRVTGPHLHFSARVSGVQVDPLQLLELLNRNLF